MKNNVRNLFAILSSKQKRSYRLGWYKDYKKITTDIQKIKKNIEGSVSNLKDPNAYLDTNYDSKDAFLKHLFLNNGNGVSGNGQSTLSNENLEKITNDDEFLEVIYDLIKNPNQSNHNKLALIWKKKVGQNNPVQTNRATAACNLELSSTVDHARFDSAFNWLQKNQYIPKYDGNNSWFEKNQFLIKYLREELKEIELDKYWINIFIWDVHENIYNPFSLKKQIVKFGPPGTGKTYRAKEDCCFQFDIWKNSFPNSNINFENVLESLQFHPSYTYEDFIEGLRPAIDKDGQAQLILQNGTFKSHCKKAAKWEIDVYHLGLNKGWGYVTISDLEPHRDKLNDTWWNYIFELDDKDLLISEVVPPYFIFIDEINRAELSRVFGELMICLEYRGVEGKIKTQYNQLNTPESGMLNTNNGYYFFIPENLYVMATMNTIDRSVESFDFALRRRFNWEEINPSPQLLRFHLEEYNPKWNDLSNNLKTLNDKIKKEPILGSDYCIGHAYLWNLKYNKEINVGEVRKLIWRDNLAPLLSEYLRGTGKSEVLKGLEKSFGL